MESHIELSEILDWGLPLSYSTAYNVPHVLNRIHIRTTSRSRQCRNGFLAEIIANESRSVRSGVIIHKNRPCTERVIVKVGYNDRMQDVTVVFNATEVSFYSHQRQLAIV